ncbi:MAG TPA: hypothetical protein VL979_07955 [Solirubrobacteraceae bacterium]|nr:hypothetical protein [Solirubrobacteraceae bacterium]
MPGAYTSVRGAALVGLIRETRSAFLAGPPVATYDPELPNSLRLVALETYTGKDKSDQLVIVADVIGSDTDLLIERTPEDIFRHAGNAGAFVEDLVCEIVCQVLSTDSEIVAEDQSRCRTAA